MQRLKALDPETTTGKSKELFNAIQGKLGMVPNMMRTMGNPPAVLNGYLSLSTALGEGLLGAKLGELIALTVANANSCDFSRVLIEKRGNVSDADLTVISEAGYGDAEIAEILAHVGLNSLTNYFNHTAQVTVDFPEVELIEAAVI